MTIGIDPGLTGAIAALDYEGRPLAVYDMPVQAYGRGKKQINAHELASILYEIDDRYNLGSTVWIERVSAMPGQGVTSMFTFGEGCGVIRGVISTMRLPFQYVTPQSWKKFCGLRGTEKDYARTRARQLIPDAVHMLTRKKDIGRADALLIAYYGWKQIKPMRTS